MLYLKLINQHGFGNFERKAITAIACLSALCGLRIHTVTTHTFVRFIFKAHTFLSYKERERIIFVPLVLFHSCTLFYSQIKTIFKRRGLEALPTHIDKKTNHKNLKFRCLNVQIFKVISKYNILNSENQDKFLQIF